MTRQPRLALLEALGCLLALVAVWATAFLAPFGHWLDEATLMGFVDLHSPWIDRIARNVGRLADPQPFVVAGTAMVAVALARGRPRTAAVVPLILLGANLMTQWLKPVLADPRVSSAATDLHVQAASWPSGHATGAMSLALCAVLVAPSRLRPIVAALGGMFAVGVGYATLVLAWHLPSDVLAGFLVATLWTALGIAGLWAAARRWPSGRGREAAVRVGEALTPSALAAVTAAACAGALALARPDAALAYAQAHTTFVVGALSIAALGAALAAALAVALRR